MVSVPVRGAPLLGATMNSTEALPVPDAPELIVIQGAFETAVHAQLPAAVTATLPGPPASVIDCVVGAIEYVHDGAAADCVTVNACPAIVSVPVRAAPAFALTVNATVPLPLPEPPLAIAIQLAFGVAVHEQLASVVTVTVPEPPGSEEAWLVG